MKRKALIYFIKRKKLMVIVISIIAVTFVSGIVFAVSRAKHSNADAKAASSDDNDFTYVSPSPDEDAETKAEIKKEIKNFVPATKMDLDPDSVTVYVNKEYALPKTYRPANLVNPNVRFSCSYADERSLMRPVAARALEKLFNSAEKSGYYLTGVSAFRSYQRQYQIFINNIITKGKEHTLLYSAAPGTSEHQTGLAIDLSSVSLGNRLDDTFAETPEGKWIAKNSYRFGYIVRYPKDMAEVTGYAYEPWHIRYVGIPLAYYLYKHNLTLDEYYKYTPSPNFDYEQKYAALINYVPPTATPKPTVTPTPSVTPTPTPEPTKKPGKKSDDSTKNNGSVTSTPTPTPVTKISGTPKKGSSGSTGSGSKTSDSSSSNN